MARQPDSLQLQPHYGDRRDYNGTGIWSVLEVQARYRRYCELLQVRDPSLPEPSQHTEGQIVWIYPVMDSVIQGIERGDAACIALGVDFVEEDTLFPFGKILKSNAARSLRRAPLTEEQKSRLRERIVTMLVSGIIPHEMREYAKLLRVIGVGDQWPRLEFGIPKDNPFAMRFYKVLRAAEGLQASTET
jgi:hypothetical protein